MPEVYQVTKEDVEAAIESIHLDRLKELATATDALMEEAKKKDSGDPKEPWGLIERLVAVDQAGMRHQAIQWVSGWLSVIDDPGTPGYVDRMLLKTIQTQQLKVVRENDILSRAILEALTLVDKVAHGEVEE